MEIYEEDITFINIYAPNRGEPKYKAIINRLKDRNKQQHNNRI